MAQSYAASVEIHRLKKDGTLDEGAPKVCFKRDGLRFECEHTLKLLVDTHYEFVVNVRPPMSIHSATVNGTSVTIVDLSDPKKSQAHNSGGCGGGCGSTYSFKWDTTNLEPDKRKKRTPLTLDLHFQGNLNMIMALQVKLYKLEDEEHLTWGNTLGRVDFEYELK
ncbi:PREDICTED: uncharacterized protein LOC108373714, partial [Rhagoletis zephyria]|uniref:uncharacterized protein LOC108373714 n=1 Tax=Rhagoletis zephyria TaxID=28612 RepID=UPI000811777E